MRILSFLLGLFASVAHAQTTLNGAGAGGAGVDTMWSNICGTIPCSTRVGVGGRTLIQALALAVRDFIFPLTAAVAVCLVIYAGILIVTSNGSEDKIGEAKKIILYASIGVALSLLTTAVFNFLPTFLSGILS